MSQPRIWEPYMTDEERAFFREFRQEWGRRPAVLVIDAYNVVMGDRPEPVAEAVKRFPRSTGERGWQAIPHVQRLLTTARAAGVPIIYSTKDARPEAASGTLASTKGPGKGPAKFRPASAEREWESAIFPDIAPEPGDLVIYKPRASAFFSTALNPVLMSLNVDTVLVVGESTSGCVRATVVEAFSIGYKAVVIEDGVWDRSWVCHCINLFDMHYKYADVVGVAEAVAYLDRLHAASAGR